MSMSRNVFLFCHAVRITLESKKSIATDCEAKMLRYEVQHCVVVFMYFASQIIRQGSFK